MVFITISQVVKMLIIVITCFNIYLIQSSYGSVNTTYRTDNQATSSTANIDNQVSINTTNIDNQASSSTANIDNQATSSTANIVHLTSSSLNVDDSIDPADPNKVNKCAEKLKSKFNNCETSIDCLIFISDNKIKLEFKEYKDKDYWNFVTDLGDKVPLNKLISPNHFCSDANPSHYPNEKIKKEREYKRKRNEPGWKMYVKNLCLKELENIGVNLANPNVKEMFRFVYENYVSSRFPEGTFARGYIMKVLSITNSCKRRVFDKMEIDRWCKIKFSRQLRRT